MANAAEVSTPLVWNITDERYETSAFAPMPNARLIRNGSALLISVMARQMATMPTHNRIDRAHPDAKEPLLTVIAKHKNAARLIIPSMNIASLPALSLTNAPKEESIRGTE